MLTPTRDKLAYLADKGADFLADWLWVGLAGYLAGTAAHPPGSRFHFPGAAPYIGLSDSLADDLAEIARALEKRDQADFAEACARVLPHLDLDSDVDADIGELILRLAANLQAYPVLRSIQSMRRRNPDLPGADRLALLALDVVRSLSRPAYPEAAVCIEHLIGGDAARLTRGQAEGALLAMVEADPSRLVAHLKLLSEPLECEYGVRDDPYEERMRVADRRRLLAQVVKVAIDPVALRASAQPGAMLRGTGLDSGMRNDVKDWWADTIINDLTEPVAELRQRLGLPDPDPRLVAPPTESTGPSRPRPPPFVAPPAIPTPPEVRGILAHPAFRRVADRRGEQRP